MISFTEVFDKIARFFIHLFKALFFVVLYLYGVVSHPLKSMRSWGKVVEIFLSREFTIDVNVDEFPTFNVHKPLVWRLQRMYCMNHQNQDISVLTDKQSNTNGSFWTEPDKLLFSCLLQYDYKVVDLGFLRMIWGINYPCKWKLMDILKEIFLQNCASWIRF